MNTDIQAQIKELKSQLTGDMMKDMDIRDQIHELEMKEKGVTCSLDDPECEACGS